MFEILERLAQPENLISLATLTLMEIVLGIDNIVFITILSGKLPKSQQARARRIGLMLAMVMRIGLLLSLSWVMGLTDPWFELFGKGFSGRDLILLGGGLFLVAKATFEITRSERMKARRPQVRARLRAGHRAIGLHSTSFIRSTRGDHRRRHGAVLPVMILAIVRSRSAS